MLLIFYQVFIAFETISRMLHLWIVYVRILVGKLLYVTQGESCSLQLNVAEVQRKEENSYWPVYGQPENFYKECLFSFLSKQV